jgi:hypothetical protein
MVYSPHAPYEVLQTNDVDFPTMQRIRRFSRYWDLVANSGNFVETAPLLWADDASPFGRFMELSERLFERFGQAHGIALHDLAEFVFQHLARRLARDPEHVAQVMWRDYQRGGRVDCPPFLREHVPEPERRVLRAQSFARTALPRQSRHTHR